MKATIACSMMSEVTTELPPSMANRRMAVRAMPFTSCGTRSMRASASSVQTTLSSARWSSGGTYTLLDSSTSAGSQAQEVLGVAAQIHLIALAVNADASKNQKPRLSLAGMLQDLLEYLAGQQCQLDVDAFLSRAMSRATSQVRLVNLGQAGCR